MCNDPVPQINSFVIRFIMDESIPLSEAETWRGAIKHVQSENEMTFTNWRDAVIFMGKFLPANILEESKHT